jgi:hypothetical protein
MQLGLWHRDSDQSRTRGARGQPPKYYESVYRVFMTPPPSVRLPIAPQNDAPRRRALDSGRKRFRPVASANGHQNGRAAEPEAEVTALIS